MYNFQFFTNYFLKEIGRPTNLKILENKLQVPQDLKLKNITTIPHLKVLPHKGPRVLRWGFQRE